MANCIKVAANASRSVYVALFSDNFVFVVNNNLIVKQLQCHTFESAEHNFLREAEERRLTLVQD